MLVLSRKKLETLVIGDNIEITVVSIQRNRVKLAINAPDDVVIVRKEILNELERKSHLLDRADRYPTKHAERNIA